MALRCAALRISSSSRLLLASSMEGMYRTPRYFSDGKGRILSEEERAKEKVYIQKMERERLEKLRQRAEKEKMESEKASASTDHKKTEEHHQG